ncbi:hypothetical protein HALLA_06150 [Halostagnicola larsenii XH-48]|uniref:Uncharacterized protein n=1 Tax=Halostagnicola larsenii XH-48 TaxID=797299 RepID=W0JQ76_9EURY|nr:hypothetical protein HALLA_06150 [Halostagnicola larsenii XH-48]
MCIVPTDGYPCPMTFWVLFEPRDWAVDSRLGRG